MNSFRLLAIATLSILFWNFLSGQEPPSSDSSVWLLDQQSFAVDSLSFDSISGELQIPNVFSPNGDGRNEYFEVRTNGESIYEFSLFTRSGACIFRSRSPYIFWDGRSNTGMEQSSGVYFYVIEEESKPYKKTGFIYLYR